MEKVPLNNKIVPSHTGLPEKADPYDHDAYSDLWLTDYSPELMKQEVIQFIKVNKKTAVLYVLCQSYSAQSATGTKKVGGLLC